MFAELSLLAVLMLRGAQTPGELRQRSERLYAFATAEELQSLLEGLAQRRMIVRYERRPGQKEARWGLGETFGGATEPAPMEHVEYRPGEPLAEAVNGADGLATRVAALEAGLAELRGVVDRLRELLD